MSCFMFSLSILHPNYCAASPHTDSVHRIPVLLCSLLLQWLVSKMPQDVATGVNRIQYVQWGAPSNHLGLPLQLETRPGRIHRLGKRGLIPSSVWLRVLHSNLQANDEGSTGSVVNQKHGQHCSRTRNSLCHWRIFHTMALFHKFILLHRIQNVLLVTINDWVTKMFICLHSEAHNQKVIHYGTVYKKISSLCVCTRVNKSTIGHYIFLVSK